MCHPCHLRAQRLAQRRKTPPRWWVLGFLVQLPGAKVQDAIGEVGSAVASGWDAKGSGERQFLWILMV